MATQDISIWDEGWTKSVDIITDSVAKNRLAVDVIGTISGGSIYTVPPNTHTVELTGNPANVTLITPTSGKKIQVIGAFVTGKTAGFLLKIQFVTSAKIVQEHQVNGTLGNYIPTNITGATNEVLGITITGSGVNDKWFICINYVEV